MLFTLSLWAQEGKAQATLTISSASTTSGWTYNSGTRTVTVTSTSIANATTILGYLNTGPLTIVGASPNLSVTLSSALNSIGTANGLTIGAVGNTGTITLDGALTLKGGLTLNGGNIDVNQGINTTAGGINGDLLIKASGNIVIKQDVNISSNGGDMIFWANSDGASANGGVYFKDGNYSPTTPSIGIDVTTGGGHIWIGGGSGTTTWNGLTVGDGAAVSGRTTEDVYAPSLPDIDDWQAGVVFNKTNLSSGGGDIYIAGTCNATPPEDFKGSGIINYSGVRGTTIDAGSGTVKMIGNTTTFGFGIMTGLHPDEYTGQFVVKSSNNTSSYAIMLEGHADPDDGSDGILIENHTRLISTAATSGGGISILGSSILGFGLNVAADYRLDVLSASGGINVETGETSLGLSATSIMNLGSISGDADVAASAAIVNIISDDLPVAGNIPIRTTGACNIKHTAGSSFIWDFVNNPFSFDGVTALTIGDADNDAAGGVSITKALSIAGPITIHGGAFIEIHKDITSTTTGDITLNTVNNIFSSPSTRKSIVSAGGNITIHADLDANGNGFLALSNLTLNPGAGNIIVRGETFVWSDVDPLPYINGTGSFTFESSDASFGGDLNTKLFNFDQDANGMSGLTLGKSTNARKITHDNTSGISVAGPIKMYAGDLQLDQAITSTGGATGTIELYAEGNLTMNVPLTATGDKTVEVVGDFLSNGDITNLKFEGNAPQAISGTSTIKNLTVDKDPNTIAELTGGMFSVTDVLDIPRGKLKVSPVPSFLPGFLTLKSSSNGTARVPYHSFLGSILGNVIVERFIPATVGAVGRQKQWRTLGFPFTQFEMSQISGIGISYTTGAESFMTFYESADDRKYGNTGPRNAGYSVVTSATQSIQGYQGVMAWLYGPDNSTPLTGGNISSDLTISCYGELRETGTDVVYQSPAITNNFEGWNLVSNPFVSPIDWRVVLTSGAYIDNIASTIYRWDPIAANWTSYNGSTSAAVGNGSPYIESGSAFFIKAATAKVNGGSSSMTLTLTQTSKVANTENKHFSKAPFRLDIPGERVPATSTLAGLRLKASGMGNPIPGEAYLDVSRTDATKGWDPKYDGWMMSRSSGANVYFDGEKDQDFSMQFDAPLKTGEQRYYPLTVTTPQAGETLIDIASEGKWPATHTVALIDQQAGKTIMMKGDTIKYKVRLDELKSEGRFVLAINHVKPDTDGSMPSLQLKVLGNPVAGNIIDLLVSHPTASAKRWKVWDMTGREAGSGVFSTDAGIQHRLTVLGMRNPGIYLVQVEMDNGETSQLRVQRN
jgi:hypothetical protein